MRYEALKSNQQPAAPDHPPDSLVSPNPMQKVVSSHLMPVYNRSPIAFERGSGSTLFATDGTAYLDFGSGVAVNALGHSHPRLVDALVNQARKLYFRRKPTQITAADVAKTYAARVVGTAERESAAVAPGAETLFRLVCHVDDGNRSGTSRNRH